MYVRHLSSLPPDMFYSVRESMLAEHFLYKVRTKLAITLTLDRSMSSKKGRDQKLLSCMRFHTGATQGNFEICFSSATNLPELRGRMSARRRNTAIVAEIFSAGPVCFSMRRIFAASLSLVLKLAPLQENRYFTFQLELP
jgi:hypothetical protein